MEGLDPLLGEGLGFGGHVVEGGGVLLEEALPEGEAGGVVPVAVDVHLWAEAGLDLEEVGFLGLDVGLLGILEGLEGFVADVGEEGADGCAEDGGGVDLALAVHGAEDLAEGLDFFEDVFGD